MYGHLIHLENHVISYINHKTHSLHTFADHNSKNTELKENYLHSLDSAEEEIWGKKNKINPSFISQKSTYKIEYCLNTVHVTILEK